MRLDRVAILTSFLIPASLAAARPIAAQSVVGTVTEEDTGAPVVGAFVRLLDHGTGEVRAGALTDRTGRYAIRAPDPGRYRLRVERIGFATTESDPFTLERERSIRRAIAVVPAAIALEGIDVEGEGRCRVRPEDGLAVARVWEEARKALTVAQWTDAERALQYRLEFYTRQIDARSLEVVNEARADAVALYEGSPFESTSTDTLLALGFVREDGAGGYIFDAPDANVLLADAFADTHCFRIRIGDDGGLIGLAFEPVRDRGVVDVHGTLWLDRRSGELRHLEYGYTQLPWRLDRADLLGGRVDFRRLATGDWIVPRWWIRMPVAATRRRGRRVAALTAIHERGARILATRTPDGQLLAEAAGATLYGVVTDSLRGEPVPGARIDLTGTVHSTLSAADGSFRLEGIPDGRYTLVVTTDALAALGHPPSASVVMLASGRATRVRAAVPPLARAARAVCGTAVSDTTGVVFGVVRDPVTGKPAVAAVVGVTWSRLRGPVDTAADRHWVREEVRTDAAGQYHVCGVPVGETLLIAAVPESRRDDVTGGGLRLRAGIGSPPPGTSILVPRDGLLRRDLTLAADGGGAR